MSFKTKDGKTHLSHVLFGENGLPVDSIATISGSYVFLEGALPLVSYSGGVVTLPAGYDLTPVTVAKARYTGKYILLTQDNKIYYIDKVSIDVPAGTFLVSTSDKSQSNPVTLDLLAGWTIAEADIVNRLATTSAAKIDSIDFRDMHFQMQLDGDPVTVVDGNGDLVDFATEQTQLANNQELQSINSELDTHTIQLQEVNDELDSQTSLLNHIDSDLHTANAELAEVNDNLDSIELKLDDVNSELDGIHSDLNAQADQTQTILQTEFDQTQALLQAEFDQSQEISTSINNKIANNYGVSTSAIRTAAQIGNTAGQADFDRGDASTQTIRVTQASDDGFAKEAKQDAQIVQLQTLITDSESNNNLYQRILPLLTNANFLANANFDTINQSFAGDTAILSYLQDTFEIAKVTIRFTSAHDWDLSMERYILAEDGTKLLDEHGNPLFLE